MIKLEPLKHLETGTPYPLWMKVCRSVGVLDENFIKKMLAESLGPPSGYMSVWSWKITHGWFVLMFRNPEDVNLAKIILGCAE